MYVSRALGARDSCFSNFWMMGEGLRCGGIHHKAFCGVDSIWDISSVGKGKLGDGEMIMAF